MPLEAEFVPLHGEGNYNPFTRPRLIVNRMKNYQAFGWQDPLALFEVVKKYRQVN